MIEKIEKILGKEQTKEAISITGLSSDLLGETSIAFTSLMVLEDPQGPTLIYTGKKRGTHIELMIYKSESNTHPVLGESNQYRGVISISRPRQTETIQDVYIEKVSYEALYAKGKDGQDILKIDTKGTIPEIKINYN